MTTPMTGQESGALERAATLTLAARADLDGTVRDLSARLNLGTTQWEGAGARAFQSAYAGWAEQQQRVLATLSWFHDQLRAIEALNTATDVDQAARFGAHA